MTPGRAKAIGILVAVFLLGALAGAGGAHAFGKRRMAELVGEERGTLLEERRMRALRRSLDLTEEQSRQVREVFAKHREAHREAMEALFRDCGEPLAEVREAIDEEIGAILTPEQRTRYAELRTRHGRRFLGPRPHGRPHGPPGR